MALLGSFLPFVAPNAQGVRTWNSNNQIWILSNWFDSMPRTWRDRIRREKEMVHGLQICLLNNYLLKQYVGRRFICAYAGAFEDTEFCEMKIMDRGSCWFDTRPPSIVCVCSTDSVVSFFIRRVGIRKAMHRQKIWIGSRFFGHGHALIYNLRSIPLLHRCMSLES